MMPSWHVYVCKRSASLYENDTSPHSKSTHTLCFPECAFPFPQARSAIRSLVTLSLAVRQFPFHRKMGG